MKTLKLAILLTGPTEAGSSKMYAKILKKGRLDATPNADANRDLTIFILDFQKKKKLRLVLFCHLLMECVCKAI